MMPVFVKQCLSCHENNARYGVAEILAKHEQTNHRALTVPKFNFDILPQLSLSINCKSFCKTPTK